MLRGVVSISGSPRLADSGRVQQPFFGSDVSEAGVLRYMHQDGVDGPIDVEVDLRAMGYRLYVFRLGT